MSIPRARLRPGERERETEREKERERERETLTLQLENMTGVNVKLPPQYSQPPLL